MSKSQGRESIYIDYEKLTNITSPTTEDLENALVKRFVTKEERIKNRESFIETFNSLKKE